VIEIDMGIKLMSVSILEGVIVRPVTMDDLLPVVEMFNRCAIKDEGAVEFTVDRVRVEWQSPAFNLETDTRITVMTDGTITGYIEVWDTHELHVRPNLWGRVHPEYRGNGFGSILLEWAEERARQAIAKAPANARVTTGSFLVGACPDAAELYEKHGFRHERDSWQMQIKLTVPPPSPQWPEGISLRLLNPAQGEEEYRRVFNAMNDSFQDHYGYLPMEFDRWLYFTKNDPDFDPTLWFIAEDGDQIAGLCLCDPKTPEDPEMAWIDLLGVCRPWRKRGLGLALLHQAFGEFYRRGIPKAGLGVDAQSLTGATRLYERAGMHVAKRWLQFRKELRPGVELSTQTVQE
jgi:mycothiol synthase